MVKLVVDNALRRLPSWIQCFEQFSAGFKSPPILRRWAAISAVSAAMERKVWCRTLDTDLYANLFVILVAPPGIGKGQAFNTIESLWQNLSDLHIAPSSTTAAAVIDSLAEAKRKIVRPASVPPYIEFNSLYCIAPELSVLLPAYDSEMMAHLTDFWDCRAVPFKQRRRTKELKITINNPQLSLLGGTTPSYLGQFLPEGAWDQGFMSRTIMIYSAEEIRVSLFKRNISDIRHEDLLHDLKGISELVGKMEWEEEAAVAIEHWNAQGGPPEPDHPKLLNYRARRVVNLLKLCMVASASRGDSLRISVEDYQTALDWLLEAEAAMPDIFKAMVTGGDATAMEETWHFAFKAFAREKQPILEHRLVNFIRERVPSYSVLKVLDIMVRSGLLKQHVDAKGLVGYLPGQKDVSP